MLYIYLCYIQPQVGRQVYVIRCYIYLCYIYHRLVGREGGRQGGFTLGVQMFVYICSYIYVCMYVPVCLDNQVDFAEWDGFIRACFAKKKKLFSRRFSDIGLLNMLEHNYKTRCSLHGQVPSIVPFVVSYIYIYIYSRQYT